MIRTNEAAFETVIEAQLLANGYVAVDRNGFDRERAIFPETAVAFIHVSRSSSSSAARWCTSPWTPKRCS